MVAQVLQIGLGFLYNLVCNAGLTQDSSQVQLKVKVTENENQYYC